MSLSGTFYGTTSNQYIQPKIVWSATQSVSGNYSIVTATLYYSRTNSGYTTYGTGTFYIAINGEVNGYTQNISISENSNTLAVTNTVKVQHENDGTKTITISGSGGISGTTFTSTSISANVTLDTIPRKSTMSANNGTLGSSQTLTISRASSSFTHSIRYDCGSASGAIVTKTSSTSISWSPPLGLASQNTTGTSVSIKLTLYTFNGDTEIGTTTTTITCSIPDSVKPSCSVSVTDATGYESTYGNPIKGLSKFSVTVTPTTSYGASITSYNTSANGSTYTASSFTTNAIVSYGSQTIKATVTDKRGRTGTASVTKNVLDYSPPAITALKVNRCNSDGTENSQGEYVKVTFSSSITSLSNKNTATYRIDYKKVGDETYISDNLSDYINNYSVQSATYVFNADTGSSYDVRIVASDNFGSVSKSTSASTAFTIMHLNADGTAVAFGKVSEKSNSAEFDLDVYAEKLIYDRFGQQITNGLAEYSDAASGYIDPNTTSSHLILTAHENAPMGSGVFYYIITMWYAGKSTSAYRAQFGIPYNRDGSMYHRYYNGSWSHWRRHINADELEDLNVELLTARKMTIEWTYPSLYFKNSVGNVVGCLVSYGTDNSGPMALRVYHNNGTNYVEYQFKGPTSASNSIVVVS